MDLREINLIDIGIIVNNLELIATFDRLNTLTSNTKTHLYLTSMTEHKKTKNTT